MLISAMTLLLSAVAFQVQTGIPADAPTGVPPGVQSSAETDPVETVMVDPEQQAKLEFALRSPRDIAASNPDLTNLMRGDIMMARKMYREAIDFYKLEADTDAFMANKTGMAYHQLGDLRNAMKFYNKALKIDKYYTDALNNRGAVNHANKYYYRAQEDYERALAIDPLSSTTWMNLGTTYFEQENYQQAFTCYINALRLDPLVFERRGSGGVKVQERSVEEKALFYYMLAKTYARAGNADAALRYIRFALENEFEDAELFLNEVEFAFLAENEEFQTLMNSYLAPAAAPEG